MSRPFIKFRLEELRTLVASKPELKSQVVLELQHRRTKGALDLLSHLTGIPGGKLATQPGMSNSTPNSPSDISEKYEALRATFSAEAENLAMWGITPTMPKSVRLAALGAWKLLLTEKPDLHGRSLSALSEITRKTRQLEK